MMTDWREMVVGAPIHVGTKDGETVTMYASGVTGDGPSPGPQQGIPA